MGEIADVKDGHVLIVEDMIDTGKTLIKLREKLYQQGATKVETCIAFQMKSVRNMQIDYQADYIGFYIPDKFVIGYGLDYNQRFRDLMHLCVISKKGIEMYKK